MGLVSRTLPVEWGERNPEEEQGIGVCTGEKRGSRCFTSVCFASFHQQ